MRAHAGDVQPGERVYFHENATEEDRKMGPYQGGMMYAIRVDEIQAVIRKTTPFQGYTAFKKEEIVMQGGWVLVRPDMETWEEIALRLADQAGIATPQHELIDVAGKAVMLSRRFDRDDAIRIPNR